MTASSGITTIPNVIKIRLRVFEFNHAPYILTSVLHSGSGWLHIVGTDWLRGGGYVAQIRMNVVEMRNRTDASAGNRTSVIQRAKLEDLEDALII